MVFLNFSIARPALAISLAILINSGEANMGVMPSNPWNKLPIGGSLASGAIAPYIRGQ